MCYFQSQFEDTMDAGQIPLAISVFFGLPLHFLIIYRLSTRKMNFNKYHRLLIASSVDDVLLILSRIVYVWLTLDPCNIAGMVFYIVNYISDLLFSFGIVTVAILATYWKSIIKPQKYLDLLLYAGIILPNFYYIPFSTLDYYAAITCNGSDDCNDISEFTTTWQIHFIIAYYGPIFGVCLATFLIVGFMDKSKFGGQTLRSHKKMTMSLMIQASLLAFCLITSYLTPLLKLITVNSRKQIDKWESELTFAGLSTEKEKTIIGYIINEERKEEQIDGIIHLINYDLPPIIPFFKALLTFWSIRHILKPKTDVVPVSSGFRRSSSVNFMVKH